ncbi:MAG: lipoprotein signal peptidase [Cryomorphaceae bacterium]|nr:lipoprotein signal peptidase [Cryomorphaceae bacterium]
MSKYKHAIFVVFAVLIIDQILKIWIKMNWTIGEHLTLIDGFFELHFIENNGMAFGINLPGVWGKLALSLFRIAAVVAIGFYLKKNIDQKAHKGFVTCVAMILAGAVGNIIDSAVYGVFFSRSSLGQVAELFPTDGGYASSGALGGYLEGYVVDMLHFTVRWPEWVPYFGGSGEIFPPIFNIADAAISLGIIWIIIRQKKFFAAEKAEDIVADVESAPEEA